MGVAAGVFFMTALVFALVGCAWLLYFYLPVGEFAYFWGFFAMAVILVILGVIAGLIAAKVVKKSSPPVPNMAMEEARKIREAVSADAAGAADGQPSAPVPAVPTGGEELMAQRTPAEIRSSMEANRAELAVSVARLRGEVTRATDWRAHVERHRTEIRSGPRWSV